MLDLFIGLAFRIMEGKGMNIFVIGINYRLAAVEIREKLKIGEDEYASVLQKLKDLSEVSECSIISTCNRTEVYLYSENCEFDSDCIEKLLCQIKGLDIYSMKKYFYFYKGTKALKHIFSVACGMDSMARFEDQILGQFKSAHEISLKAGTTSTVLNTLLRQAVTTAKRIKTRIGSLRDSTSIADAAVKTVEKMFNSYKDRCAMVIGTGSVGAAVLGRLVEMGIGKIHITRRTHSKTVLIPQFNENVVVIDYSSRYEYIDECDIVISSTSSPHYTITRDMLETSIRNRDKERLFIDLAVPRDFDAAIQKLDYVRYYNIDDMKTDDGNECIGEDDVVSVVEEMIGEGVLEFRKWYEFRCVMPYVKDIQRFSEEIVREKTDYALAKLKFLDEGEKGVVKATISSAVNSIMDRLVYGAREFGSSQEREIYLRYLRDIVMNNQ